MIHPIPLIRPYGICSCIGALFRRGINLSVIVDIGNSLYPEQTAIVEDEKEISYQKLYRHTLILGCQLQKRYTLKKDRRVAIACRNHTGYVYALFAVASTGADVYIVHPDMGNDALAELIHRFRFDLFIHDNEINISPEMIHNYDHFLPVHSNSGNSLAALLQQPPEEAYRPGRSHFGKVVVLTSGSTGQAKTAARKASATAFLSPFISLLKQLGLHRYDSLYPATPFSHGFGLAALLVALVLGKRVYLLKRFDVIHASQLIERHRIEVLTVVPAMIARLLDTPDYSLSSVRCILSGGDRLLPALIEKAAQRLKGNYIYNLYGTSEAGFCFMATPAALAYQPRTIGKPLNGVKVRIRTSGKKSLPEESIGELCIKCNWSAQKDKWIPTGDLAYKDRKGYYFLSGRTDDMIVSGGENIYPYELENILVKHPQIREAAVIGVPDPDFGKRLKAFIVSSGESLREPELRDWLRGRCARYQMPREIRFLPALPYLPNGKIYMPELKKHP